VDQRCTVDCCCGKTQLMKHGSNLIFTATTFTGGSYECLAWQSEEYITLFRWESAGDRVTFREATCKEELHSWPVVQLYNCTVKALLTTKKLYGEKRPLFPSNLEETGQLHASVKWKRLLVNFCGNRPYQSSYFCTTGSTRHIAE